MEFQGPLPHGWEPLKTKPIPICISQIWVSFMGHAREREQDHSQELARYH